MRRFFRLPLDDLIACLERLAESRRPYAALLVTGLSLVVTWFVYVPIHELLHVLGCVVTGGAVSRLEIAPQYGAELLARWFPFVVSGGDYAGRLSGFDWKDSDLIYLATDFAPFLLTILIGVPLVKVCAARGRPLLLGAAVVIGLAPFYNVIGDYYEMGSIITTRAVSIAGGAAKPAFTNLRSDDVFKLIGDLVSKPAELGLSGTGRVLAGWGLVLLSIALAILLGFLTYALGTAFAWIVLRGRFAFSTPTGRVAQRFSGGGAEDTFDSSPPLKSSGTRR